MTRSRALLPSAQTTGLFLFVFAVFEIYLRAFADPRFYYDAANYWSLSGTFGRGGHFALLDFQSAIRGYSLPLYDRALSSVASLFGVSGVTIVQLAGSLQVALLGVVLIPGVVRSVWPAAEISFVRILLLNAIIFIFWRDHLGFPLSDFPAATLGAGALYALSRRSLPGYALTGLAAGLAWNVRQGYLVMMLVVIVVVVARAGVRRASLRGAAAIALVLAGVALASLPQILINHRHFDSWSPTVYQAKLIALGNLAQGMNAQRYETYVGKGRQPAVFYLDPATKKVLAQEHLVAFQSYSQYVRVSWDHPIEMIGGWTRRMFDGLDVRYTTPYVHDLGSHSEWFSLLDYTLLFAAATRLLAPTFRRQLGRAGWVEALALCSATATAVPLAAESRYYLPIYLVLYSIVVFGAGTRQAFADLGRAGKITLAVLYPLFLLVCITLSASSVALMAAS
jgi:hypothetical protein